jgi:hypothetical protein
MPQPHAACRSHCRSLLLLLKLLLCLLLLRLPLLFSKTGHDHATGARRCEGTTGARRARQGRGLESARALPSLAGVPGTGSARTVKDATTP